MKLLMICLCEQKAPRFQELCRSLFSQPLETIYTPEDFSHRIDDLKNQKLVFLVHVDKTGINLALMEILKNINLEKQCLKNTACGIIVDGENELHTKNIAKKIALTINMAGGILPGHAFAEGTGSLQNQQTYAANARISFKEAFFEKSRQVIETVCRYQPQLLQKETPKILCLYAGNPETSNTYLYWKLVKKNLQGSIYKIQEINLQNGEITDCKGCPYEICLHYGQQNSCFYGGLIVEQVYPAVIESDIIILLCPNYNDALSANMTAFINRLTAIYRTTDFSRKYLFAVIVSGYSGGDILAEQLISALNLNKGFTITGNALQMITANASGQILKYKNIEYLAREMSENILKLNWYGTKKR